MATRANAVSADVPSYVETLPETATARGGCEFWPRRDLWELKEGTHKVALHFDELPDLEPGFKTAFKVVLLWYAENHSIRHVGNLFYRSTALFQFKLDGSLVPVSEISDIDILNYKSVIGAARQWYLGSLSRFLRRWAELGLGGITREAVAIFKQIELARKPMSAAQRRCRAKLRLKLCRRYFVWQLESVTCWRLP